MRLNVLTSLFVSSLLLTVPRISVAENPPNTFATSDAISSKDDVIRLFDGKTLGDCYTWLKDAKLEDPRKVFRVTDGMLHVTGDGLGGLVTNKRYRDYHLVLEYKWGERTWHEREKAARDSGLLVHSNGKNGGYEGCWMPSIEVQIIEGGVGDFIAVGGPDESGRPVPISITCNVSDERDRAKQAIYKPDGKRETFKRGRVDWYGRDPEWKDETGFRGKQDKDSPHGEWTRLDVFCDGGHIETFVNGAKVNEAFDVWPREGRLQLQTELAEIFYRRWELWPLGKGPKPAPAKQ
jgi:3-keto-disaccharide hydrolase